MAGLFTSETPSQPAGETVSKAGYLWGGFVSLVLLVGCAGTLYAQDNLVFHGEQVLPPNDRLHIQSQGNLTVATAVPSAEEAREIFGANLYRKNIQPVWVQVENHSDRTLFLTPMGLDVGYFTPRESAMRARSDRTRSETGPL